MRSEKEESPKNKDIEKEKEKEKEELVAINRARKGIGKQLTKKLTNVVRLTGSGKKNSSIERSPDGEFASKWMDDDEHCHIYQHNISNRPMMGIEEKSLESRISRVWLCGPAVC